MWAVSTWNSIYVLSVTRTLAHVNVMRIAQNIFIPDRDSYIQTPRAIRHSATMLNIDEVYGI